MVVFAGVGEIAVGVCLGVLMWRLLMDGYYWVRDELEEYAQRELMKREEDVAKKVAEEQFEVR